MGATKRILLIEDDPDQAFLVKSNLLVYGGYEVHHVSNGSEALEAFHANEYDLALLDYLLPDIDGLSILNRILETSKSFPVIIMTAHGSETVAVEAIKNGAYDYVIKSGDHFRLLPAILKKALEKFELVRLNEQLIRKLEEQARKDLLTDTYNKNYFFELYDREIDRARRYGRKLTVVMMDLDNFKAINDTCGHTIGDTVLARVGSILNRCSRSSDIVARYGGDEFVIVMLEAGLDEAKTMTSRIQAGIGVLNLEMNLPVEIGLSIGVAASDNGYDALIEGADRDMYKEKRNYYQKKEEQSV